MTRCSAALIWRLPAWSRRCRWVLPELAGIGATPAARELRWCGETLGAGDLTDELGGDQRPEPRLGEQLWRDLFDELGDVALELVDRGGSVRAGGAACRARSGHASSDRRARAGPRSASTTSSRTMRRRAAAARARGRAGATTTCC